MWKLQKINHNPDYDSLVKTALIAHLGEAVREVQRIHIDLIVTDGEASQTLCSVIEALFVHKLRDSFIEKVANALNDVLRQPSPNFWAVLSNFSHRHTIEYLVDSCPWLRSDIGRCRGWIRLVFNDGMLSSYLELLAGDKKLLKDCYEKEAFLRDCENVDIALKLLRGIESLEFRLAVNSSILNNWNTTPLLLAGLWVPPTHVTQEAVVLGVDAAFCFNDEEEQEQREHKKVTPEPPKIDADLAFRLIIDSDAIPLQQDAETFTLTFSPSTSSASSLDNKYNCVEGSVKVQSSGTASTHLDTKFAAIAPTSCENHPDEATNNVVKDIKIENLEEGMRRSLTFEDLLVNYSVSTIGSMKAPAEVLSAVKTKPSSVEKLDSVETFEVVTEPEKPSPLLTSMLRTINHERGLVDQNYRCFDCSRPIGLIYGLVKICAFTGAYYCPDCHSDDDDLIPARVLLNGDFSKRKISKQARRFFNDISFDPVLNTVEFDANIHQNQAHFAALLRARTQLQHLSAFLLTCRSAEVANNFRSRFCGKDYLYEDLHLYSMADLALIQSNQLLQHLSKILSFGKQHVISCSVCVLKGFICESCRSDAVIFPFDLENTYRCGGCGAVFHSKCMNDSVPCPRCERWKAKSQEEEPSHKQGELQPFI